MTDNNTAGQNEYTLDKFLEEHPWDENILGKAKPLEYFFSFTVSSSINELWPVMSDTSNLNEAVGLNKMKFTEKDGILFGSSVIAGISHEWEEVPWQWEYGRWIQAERIYSKGLVKYVRAFFIFHESGPSTEVTVNYGWITKNFISRIIFSLVRNSYQKKFINAVQGLIKKDSAPMDFFITTDGTTPLVSQPGKNRDIDTRKISQIREELLKEDFNSEIVEKLLGFVTNGDDNSLYRMRPVKLAKKLGIRQKDLINVMLHATRKGLLNLTWDIICPHCQGVRQRANHLWDVKKTNSCDSCKIDFESTGINSIEISFHPNPEVRQVDEIFYCSAEPAKKPHIKFQKDLTPEMVFPYSFPFNSGRFRMRILGRETFTLLDILADSEAAEIPWETGRESSDIEAGPGSKIIMKNLETSRQTFIIEENAVDREALRPKDIFNFQEFRDLFSDESLAEDLTIDIGVQNIAFIDVVKSTELYGREGNSRAFALMRNYFKESHDIAVKNYGSIIKTMGDAVLISFNQPINALRAAIEFITTMDGSREDFPLQTRITINRGSCLAVNLNSSIDYFGQPVNIVAKLQSYTNAGEIVITRDFINDPQVTEYLQKKGFNLDNHRDVEIKGAGTVKYWKLKFGRKKKQDSNTV